MLREGLIQRARLLDRSARRSVRPDANGARRPAAARTAVGQSRFLARVPRHQTCPAIAGCISTPPIWCARRTGGYEVLNDRTQAPSGAGYSLENRIVLSRALAGRISRSATCSGSRRSSRRCGIRCFRSRPRIAANPRIVLLTPGPYNETYFEHSYLARYLGYPLVQGNDLTVRDATVYLKTVGGLQRVDVILRSVDDNFCDPLELFAGSYLGVPGLLQSIRQGNVAVANALGTGVLQAPGFLPFLPGTLPASARRRFEASLGAHLVVRPAQGIASSCSSICPSW